MNKSREIKLKTPAKINYFLKVLDKRPDGYHNIETIFLPLDNLFDEIIIKTREIEGIVIKCDKEEVPCDERNLCYKSAILFSKLTKIAPNWEITIKKNIPITAGMGGGSSDAAATILLLEKLYNIKIQREILIPHLSKLGADIPYFLNPTPSIATGIGEIITPFELKKNLHILIAAPCFPVSAAWAYKNMISDKKCKNLDINDAIRLLNSDSSEKFKYAKNDLADALFNKFPILKVIKIDLEGMGSCATEITGSGPTIFSVFEETEDLEKAKLNIQKKYEKSIQLFKVKSLNSQYPIIMQNNSILHIENT